MILSQPDSLSRLREMEPNISRQRVQRILIRISKLLELCFSVAESLRTPASLCIQVELWNLEI